jgi:hypothetical protein
MPTSFVAVLYAAFDTSVQPAGHAVPSDSNTPSVVEVNAEFAFAAPNISRPFHKMFVVKLLSGFRAPFLYVWANACS